MNTAVKILVGLVIIVGVGGLVYYQTRSEPVQAPEAGNHVSAEGNTQMSEGITAAEVARHKDKSSCWSIINGNVYDLTSWIPEHPGGEQGILGICGVDGSAKFNGQHGGMATQENILAGFKIGVVQ